MRSPQTIAISAAILAALVLAALALRPEQAAAPQERSSVPAPAPAGFDDEGQITVVLAPGRGVGMLGEGPPREPRDYVSDWMPARGIIGRMVQTGLSKRGDSDRRLLDGMAALGLHPSRAASWASWFDPWLAVGLVDLERQIARRCARQQDAAAQDCFGAVVSAEEDLGRVLSDPPAATALALFRQRDLAQSEGQRAVPDADMLDRLRVQLLAEPGSGPEEAWAQLLDQAWSDGDADDALWAYQGLADAVARSAPGARAVRQEALARSRAHLIVKGWLNAQDWRDALRVAALHCDPGPALVEGEQPLVYDARFEDGAWTLGKEGSSYALCIERTVGPPEPLDPIDVRLLVHLGEQ